MSQTLSLKFGLASGATRTISLAGPKSGLDAAAAQGCMNAMVASGAAFDDALTEPRKAELIERNVTVLVNNED